MSQDVHVVVGAGPLGLAVVDVLVGRGKRVRLVTRSGGEAMTGVERARGDATDPTDAERVCAGAAVVYACAQPEYTKWPTHFPPIQAGLLAGAEAAGAVYVSAENLYLYGPVDVPLTEDLPTRATGRKGKVRGEMAAAVLAAHAEGRVRTTAGRASDFYGPRVEGSAVGERFFPPILAGKDVRGLGDIDAPHSFTVVGDFARALVTLGGDERAWGRAWHVPNPPPISFRELATLAYAAAGTTGSVKATPSIIIRGLGLVVPVLREVAEMLHEFDRPFVVDDSAYRSTFGGADPTSHPDAVAATVKWYRTHALAGPAS